MRSFLTENPPRTFKPRTPSYERDFEEQVLRVINQIMPNYKAAAWKPIVRDWHGHGAQPDIAIVSNDLDDWYVVEVELASHSVSGHIAPQLETLRNGIYDRTLVRSLQQAFPDVGSETLTRLTTRDPGLLCIVDQYTEPIYRTCRSLGFDLAVLEPYYGELGGWAVLVERLPSELSRLTAPATYVLRRGPPLGNSVVMELPRSFPASLYKVRLPAEPGDHVDQFAQVQHFDRGPGLVLSLTIVPEHVRATIRVIDPAKNLAELIIEQ